jgi:hypothetical protein
MAVPPSAEREEQADDSGNENRSKTAADEARI